MNDPLFVSRRSKPQMTARPFLVGCLIFEQMDQIDFTGPIEVRSRMRAPQSSSSDGKLHLFAMCRDFAFPRM
jgi:hypothetical protein